MANNILLSTYADSWRSDPVHNIHIQAFKRSLRLGHYPAVALSAHAFSDGMETQIQDGIPWESSGL
ncbi:hypothetical protein [Fodinibius sp. AD559]|uniref:hypothetical protein n=1 Tax=Fodinibius sp. AD559 TaxID=3424179 RepID=UPI004046B531